MLLLILRRLFPSWNASPLIYLQIKSKNYFGNNTILYLHSSLAAAVLRVSPMTFIKLVDEFMNPGQRQQHHQRDSGWVGVA